MAWKNWNKAGAWFHVCKCKESSSFLGSSSPEFLLWAQGCREPGAELGGGVLGAGHSKSSGVTDSSNIVKSAWGPWRAMGCRCPPLPGLPSSPGLAWAAPGCNLFLMSPAATWGRLLTSIAFIRWRHLFRCAKQYLREPINNAGKRPAHHVPSSSGQAATPSGFYHFSSFSDSILPFIPICPLAPLQHQRVSFSWTAFHQGHLLFLLPPPHVGPCPPPLRALSASPPSAALLNLTRGDPVALPLSAIPHRSSLASCRPVISAHVHSSYRFSALSCWQPPVPGASLPWHTLSSGKNTFPSAHQRLHFGKTP